MVQFATKQMVKYKSGSSGQKITKQWKQMVERELLSWYRICTLRMSPELWKEKTHEKGTMQAPQRKQEL